MINYYNNQKIYLFIIWLFLNIILKYIHGTPPEGLTENFTWFYIIPYFLNPFFMIWEDFLGIPHTIKTLPEETIFLCCGVFSGNFGRFWLAVGSGKDFDWLYDLKIHWLWGNSRFFEGFDWLWDDWALGATLPLYLAPNQNVKKSGNFWQSILSLTNFWEDFFSIG